MRCAHLHFLRAKREMLDRPVERWQGSSKQSPRVVKLF
jgi:hypothetical protein